MDKVIELVKQYPVLYDSAHSEYKNFKQKEEIWNEIGKELGETGEYVKKKWRNLRDSYAKYLKSNTATGQQVRGYYKSWPWAQQMEYFRTFLKSPLSENFLSFTVPISEDMSTFHMNDISIKDEFKEEEINNIQTIVDSPIIANESASPPPSPSSVTVLTSPKRKKRRNVVIAKETTRQIAAAALQCPAIKDSPPNAAPSMDAIEHMFLGFAKTVKTFSPKRQALTKMKVAQFILEQELLQCSENEAKG